MDLCSGSTSLLSSIPHSTKNKEQSFLLFDFAQNFKNVFNNFISKKRLNIPKCHNSRKIFKDDCLADFEYMKRLYALEENKPLKIAFFLKKASLNPSNIARTSPQHASK